MLEFLRTSNFFVKTIHGVSPNHDSDLLHQPFGVLQGSGSGPVNWLVIVIALINAHKEKFQDTGIPDPTFATHTSKNLDAFVDDTDLWDVLLTQNNVPTSVALRL